MCVDQLNVAGSRCTREEEGCLSTQPQVFICAMFLMQVISQGQIVGRISASRPPAHRIALDSQSASVLV